MDFYRKAGFLPEGGEFSEAGIVHQAMALELPIPFEAQTGPAPGGNPASERKRRRQKRLRAEFRQFDGESDSVAGAARICWRRPSRSVRIYSQELDHSLFDHGRT